MEDTTSAVLEPQIETEQPAPAPPKIDRRSLAKRMLMDSLKSIVATVTIFVLLVAYVVQGFRVYGSCMEPNLKTGERLLGNKFIYHFKEPQRGDIIIFKYPRDPQKIYIKRVVALPGETVWIRDGKVFINGNPLNEPYLLHAPHGNYSPETVRSSNLFVMGDYRDCSNDSRYWGQLPVEDIQAKAWLRYWPVNRLDVLK